MASARWSAAPIGCGWSNLPRSSRLDLLPRFRNGTSQTELDFIDKFVVTSKQWDRTRYRHWLEQSRQSCNKGRRTPNKLPKLSECDHGQRQAHAHLSRVTPLKAGNDCTPPIRQSSSSTGSAPKITQYETVGTAAKGLEEDVCPLSRPVPAARRPIDSRIPSKVLSVSILVHPIR